MISLAGLLTYEGVALYFRWVTLSRALWIAETSAYGGLIPLLVGILCGHLFSPTVRIFLIFELGVIAGLVSWHIVN